LGRGESLLRHSFRVALLILDFSLHLSSLVSLALLVLSNSFFVALDCIEYLPLFVLELAYIGRLPSVAGLQGVNATFHHAGFSLNLARHHHRVQRVHTLVDQASTLGGEGCTLTLAGHQCGRD
jgi:hypothetical protein